MIQESEQSPLDKYKNRLADKTYVSRTFINKRKYYEKLKKVNNHPQTNKKNQQIS